MLSQTNVFVRALLEPARSVLCGVTKNAAPRACCSRGFVVELCISCGVSCDEQRLVCARNAKEEKENGPFTPQIVCRLAAESISSHTYICLIYVYLYVLYIRRTRTEHCVFSVFRDLRFEMAGMLSSKLQFPSVGALIRENKNIDHRGMNRNPVRRLHHQSSIDVIPFACKKPTLSFDISKHEL